MKKRLTSVLKKNVKLGEKVFQQLEREKERTINVIKKKNQEKIKRLRAKNVKTVIEGEKVVPDILAKYKEINIFQENNDEAHKDTNVEAKFL